MKTIKGFLINLQFFTAIPIPISLPMDNEHLEKAVKTFPLVGLVQGIFYASLWYLLVEWSPFTTLAIAFLIWLATIVLTGGIHLDGWMDASDAYFSYQNIEKRLEIMKDPRTGAFGVLSVIVLLSARFLFIYEITTSMTYLSFWLILLLPFFSKVVMGMVLLTVKVAKNEGLAFFFQRAASTKALRIYPFYLISVFVFLSLFEAALILPVMILNIVALGSYLLVRAKAVKWFGGITGDVVGATVEGTEIMLWITLWLLHYFVMA